MRRLMDLFARTLDHQGTFLETLGLTYSQAKLLWRLEIGDTPSLKELARRCGVDPSNLGGVGDRGLELGNLRYGEAVGFRLVPCPKSFCQARLAGMRWREVRLEIVGNDNSHPVDAIDPLEIRHLRDPHDCGLPFWTPTGRVEGAELLSLRLCQIPFGYRSVG